MPLYEIKSFRGGISDYDDKGIDGAFKFASNLDIRKVQDNLSCQQALEEEALTAGSRSPSASPSPSSSPSLSPSASESPSPSSTPSPSASKSPSSSISASPSTTPSASVSASPSPSTAMTTEIRDLINFFVKASDGYIYAFGDNGYIYRRDTDAYYERVYKDPDGEIKGAAERFSSSGKKYLVWATATKLHQKEIPGESDWNDTDSESGWPKTNLDDVDWHTMKSIGGSLMICNNTKLAMVGWDDSYTNEALNLIPGHLAKTIVERNGRTIIGTVNSGDPDRGVNGAIDAEIPLAQVGDGELFYADMQTSMPAKTLPGGGKVNPGGVANEIDPVTFFEWEQTALSWIDKQSVGNMALLAVYDADTGYGGVYKYGRKNKNHPFTLNLDYLLDADELGAVVNIDGTTLVSYKDGTDYGVKAVDDSTKATGTYIGLDLKAPSDKPVRIVNWKYAEVFCEPLPANCSIEFYYKLNKSGSFTQAKMEGGDTSFSAEDETKAVFLIGAKAEIFEPKVVLTPSGNVSPEVYNIKIYFE